ncbi:MAG: formate dehydrogenase subunit gamma [Halopseudomonas sp.]
MNQTLQFKGSARELFSPAGWGLLALLGCLLLSWSSLSQAGSVSEASNKGVQGADYWRQVTQGESGYSTHKTAEAGVLINRSGEDWRQLRNNQVKPYGKWALLATLAVLLVVYLLLGSNKMAQPRSGRTVERWRKFDRYLHWTVAGLFIILTLTGLSILYGRYFLPDLLGKSGFNGYLQLAKSSHNYLGVLFAFCLVLMLLKWLKNNIPSGTDLMWFVRGGGLIKGKHPHAGYMNGGEKLWYWVLVVGGVALSLSGLVLDFPALIELRDDFQTANIVHAISALVLTCGMLAHAYIGSLGTEGALEGMVNGHVDEEWAKQHHDLWYDEVAGKK